MEYNPCCFLRLGRYEKNDRLCRLWWSGSGIRLRAACTWLEIDAEAFEADQAPWIGILADGAPVARFPLLPGKRRYPVLCGMDPAYAHEIAILRDSQPVEDEPAPPILRAVYSDGKLEAARERGRLIEFIGDSLTVGEGTLGPSSAMEWRTVWMSNMCAFPSLVAERLDAEKRVLALGGWGVWRSWDGHAEHRIGRIYERLCAVNACGDKPYAFEERAADAVVINLGTNDGSTFIKEEHAGELIDRAAELLRMVRLHQPQAYILWAYGLCGQGMTPYLREAVDRVRSAGDRRLDFLPLEDCGGDLGSREHPGRAAHARAAERICECLERKWREQT